jgi:molybdate transport system substrate-binding protein
MWTTSLFPRLGIADAMAKKDRRGAVSLLWSPGRRNLPFNWSARLCVVPGVEFVGTIPPELQFVSVFSAAVVAGSKEGEASRRLIAFLTSRCRAASAIERPWNDAAKGDS